MPIRKTKTASLISQAQFTDYNGNTFVLSHWKLNTGIDRIALRTTANTMPHCLSSAYLGFHPKGTAGARAEVKATVLQCKNSKQLASKLSMMGHKWTPNSTDVLEGK